MRIRTKLTLSMLLTAMLPLVLCMGLALWHSINQTTKLTLDTTQGRLDAAAQKLSLFFSERIAEVSTYSQTAAMKTMNFGQIRPFLMAELERHGSIYEKYILGTPEGYFYNTSGGNPDVGGFRTFNDKDPNAKPKHIRKRDYWQQTVGKNTDADQKTYVSDPMISYTTGAKQIVVASTILSADGTVEGMIGGALPWHDIKNRIKQVHAEIVEQLGWDANLFLVSHTGTYWYHWDPQKVVHIKLDESGNPFINEIGEKVVVTTNIKDDALTEISSVGMRMIKGERGHASFTHPNTNDTNYIVFSPVASAGYSIGLLVPQDQIMASVEALQSKFLYAFLIAAAFTTLVAFFVSRKVSSPIVSLNEMTKKISQGNLSTTLKPIGSAEISELTESFNTMVESLKQRERSLKRSEEHLEKLNQELEQRIEARTSELADANQSLNQQMRERIATEQALRNSEELLKNTGHLAHVGGWKFDVLNEKLSWTEETFRIHNLSPQQPLNLETAINCIAEETQIAFGTAIQNAIEYGKDFDLELMLRTEKDRKTWVRVICRTLKENKTVTELIGAYQDITELKKVDRLKREFVSTVSHELRTPLTSIRGSLSLLKSGQIVQLNNDTAIQMLDVAERNSERLLLLINDLLDMEKIETEEINFAWAHCSLAHLLEQSIVENESYSRAFNVNFRLADEIPDVYVKVDKERFLQVMSNLLSNAAKFTAPGTTVDVFTSLKSENQICISVSDYGQGIPEEFQDKVFTKFSQADASDSRKQGGTGLGLSISKSIVERMGGDIGFESSAGEGCRFYFNLPIVAANTGK